MLKPFKEKFHKLVEEASTTGNQTFHCDETPLYYRKLPKKKKLWRQKYSLQLLAIKDPWISIQYLLTVMQVEFAS